MRMRRVRILFVSAVALLATGCARTDYVALGADETVPGAPNRQAEALFGYSREELIDQAVETLIPEGSRPQHENLRQTFFRTPSTHEISLYLWRHLSRARRRRRPRSTPLQHPGHAMASR